MSIKLSTMGCLVHLCTGTSHIHEQQKKKKKNLRGDNSC